MCACMYNISNLGGLLGRDAWVAVGGHILLQLQPSCRSATADLSFTLPCQAVGILDLLAGTHVPCPWPLVLFVCTLYLLVNNSHRLAARTFAAAVSGGC